VRVNPFECGGPASIKGAAIAKLHCVNSSERSRVRVVRTFVAAHPSALDCAQYLRVVDHAPDPHTRHYHIHTQRHRQDQETTTNTPTSTGARWSSSRGGTRGTRGGAFRVYGGRVNAWGAIACINSTSKHAQTQIPHSHHRSDRIPSDTLAKIPDFYSRSGGDLSWRNYLKYLEKARARMKVSTHRNH
jgi:hypothetical protein